MAGQDHPWGKLRLGQKWGVIALDFGRILSVMKLGEYERMLMWAIQEHSWDHADRRRRVDSRWPDARPFDRSLTDLAKELDPEDDGYLRKKLYEARTTLKRDGVIVERDGGLFINTDVETWSSTRLRPCYVAYGAAARTRSKDPVSVPEISPELDPVVSLKKDTDIPQKGYEEASEEANISLKKDTDIPQKGYEYPSERIRHIEQARVLESLEFQNLSLRERECEREKFTTFPDETDHGRPVEYPPATDEPFASPEALRPIPAPTRTPEESRLADSVEAVVLKATRRDKFPGGIADAAEAMVEWSMDALRDGAKPSAIRDSVGKACRKLADGMDWGSGPSYANTCLRSWKADPAVKSSGDAWKPAPPPVKYWNLDDYLEEGKRS